MPRYHQIAQALRDRIRSGDIAPGERLDNQRRLAEDFGVTLMTLRQALEVLEREGLIMRRHGLGTFVALPSVDYDILNFRAFAGDLSAVGEDVATRFLRSQLRSRRPAGRARARPRARRARVRPRAAPAGGRPPHELPGLASRGRPRRGSRQGRSRRHPATPGAVVQARHRDHERPRDRLRGDLARPRRARELGCAPGAPCFRSDRVSVDAESRPIVYDRVFIPGDRFRITRQLHYDRSVTA